MQKICCVFIAAALTVATSSVVALGANVPATGLPSASLFSATVLPELEGVISWKTLAQVETIKQGDRMVPGFGKAILGLDGKSVRVQGFVLPLDLGDQQRHFLLSAVPPHCPFCLPAGPDAIVEVMAKKKIAYGIEPILVSGKLVLLKDDPTGMLYRLTDAEPLATTRK